MRQPFQVAKGAIVAQDDRDGIEHPVKGGEDKGQQPIHTGRSALHDRRIVKAIHR